MPLAMRRRLNLSHGLLLRKGIWAGTQYAPLRQGSVLTHCPPWLCSTVLSVTTSSLVEQAREGSPDCPHPGNSPVNGTLWLLPKPTFSGSWASTSFLSLRSRKGRSTLCRRRIMRMVSSSFRSTWVPDSKSQPCLQKRGGGGGKAWRRAAVSRKAAGTCSTVGEEEHPSSGRRKFCYIIYGMPKEQVPWMVSSMLPPNSKNTPNSWLLGLPKLLSIWRLQPQR